MEPAVQFYNCIVAMDLVCVRNDRHSNESNNVAWLSNDRQL